MELSRLGPSPEPGFVSTKNERWTLIFEQSLDKPSNLDFDTPQGFFRGHPIGVVNAPEIDTTNPLRKPLLKRRPMLGFVHGDDPRRH